MYKILGEDKVMVDKLAPERLEAEYSLVSSFNKKTKRLGFFWGGGVIGESVGWGGWRRDLIDVLGGWQYWTCTSHQCVPQCNLASLDRPPRTKLPSCWLAAA